MIEYLRAEIRLMIHLWAQALKFKPHQSIEVTKAGRLQAFGCGTCKKLYWQRPEEGEIK